MVATAPAPTADPDPEPAEKCQSPALTLSIVISRSGSTGRALDEVKTLAREAAEHLAANDQISIIAFDAQPLHVSKVRSGRSRSAVVADIAHILPGAGSAIFPALDMAYMDLSAGVSERKHVLLLSDGTGPTPGIRDLVRMMAAESITVSTIGLGPSIDEALLAWIAEAGGGRFYTVADPKGLRAAFASDLDAVHLHIDPFREPEARPPRDSSSNP